MIYRLLVDYPDPNHEFLSRLYELGGGAVPIPWSKRVERRLAGGSFGLLAVIMFGLGLRAPHFANRRARFYFTERGWQKVGRHVAGEARRQGHVVKVIRRKEPDRSQVLYRDALQLAVLPRQNRASERGPLTPRASVPPDRQDRASGTASTGSWRPSAHCCPD